MNTNGSDNNQQKPADIDAMGQAYLDLPEKEKCKFFDAIWKEDHAWFTHIQKLARLEKGGIRPQTLATRSDICKEKVDRHISSPSFHRHLFNLAEMFYKKHHRKQLDWLLANHNSGIADSPQGFRNLIANEFQSDPFTPLFMAYLNEIELLSDSNSFPVPTDKQSPIKHLQEQRSKCEAIAQQLDAIANATRAAQPFDEEEAKRSIATACTEIREFRKQLDETSKSHDVSVDNWSTVEELDERLESLEAAILDASSASKQLAIFLTDLAAILRKLTIHHKASKEAQRFQAMRDAAATEIGVAAKDVENRKRPDGPVDAHEWLEWASKLDADLLEQQQHALTTNDYPQLSDFIGVLQPQWIPEANAKTVVAETLPTAVASPALPQSETTVSEPDTALQETPGAQTSPVLTAQHPADPKTTTTQPAVPAVTQPAEKAPPKDAVVTGETTRPTVSTTAPIVDPQPAPKPAPPQSHLVTQESPSAPHPMADALASIIRQPIPELAAAALTSSDNERTANITRLVWNLLDQNELGLAYQVTRAAEVELPEQNLLSPPSWLLELILLSPFGFYMQNDIVLRLQRIVSTSCHTGLFIDNAACWNNAIRHLLFAGSLHATIWTPHIGGQKILDDLHYSEPAIRDLIKTAVTIASHGQPVDPSALISINNSASVEVRQKELRRRVTDWFNSARSFNIGYQPARHVWREWLKDANLIGSLLQPIIRADGKQIAKLPDAIARLDIDRAINDTHRHVFGRHDTILGTARNVLKRHAEEAISLARDGILVFAEIAHRDAEQTNRVQPLINTFDKQTGAVIKSFETEAETSPIFVLQIAARLAARSTGTSHNLLSDMNTALLQKELIASDLIMNADLLRLDTFALGNDYRPRIAPDLCLTLDGIIRALQKGIPSLNDAFELLSERGDHIGTRCILELARITNDQALPLEVHYTKREQSIQAHQEKAKTQLIDVRRKLSEALTSGTLNETAYKDYSATVEGYDNQLSDPARCPAFETYDVLHYKLAAIDSNLTQDKNTLTDEVAKRLTRIKGAEDQKRRIKDILDSGDIHLATDYMERVENGTPLPDAVPERDTHRFLHFFGEPNSAPPADGVFGQLYRWMENTPGCDMKIVNNVQGQQSFGGLRLDEVPGGQLKDYGNVLEKWFGSKRVNSIRHVDDMQTILKGLGFVSPVIQKDVRGDKTWLSVQTEPTLDCRPVSAYGSDSKGRYTIYCVFNRPNEEQLINAFKSTPYPHAAEMIFHFGRMTSTARRRFAGLCRKQHKTILIIDDILLTFLASVRGSKMQALIECGMPFTYFMPYSTTASLLPTEMFYGREREMRALESMANDSSCLLFGGRQIGKTVLLRHVERRLHDPAKGCIAKYIDLKEAAIVFARPLEDIWRLIVESLKADAPDMFSDKVPAQLDSAWVVERIEKWLSQSPGRRILLLLDEADAFLEADALVEKGRDSFALCTKLKGLMEKTHRQFKVVFSGLHNVQRATMVGNNPIAHFGTPVCIGPLYQNGEARAAQDLIERPLACLGLFFETSDLVIRILAQANYYPNLIQIYCTNLVQHMVEKKSALGSEVFPPGTITSEDVKDVYVRNQLRDDLRHRFALTLQLDPRFRLIAHIMALYDEDQPEGFDVDWIRDQSADFWQEGFEEPIGEKGVQRISYSDFRNLLDEMVGLGILRRAPNGDTYRLRSPNVVSLLGTAEQVSQVLEDSANWEKPPQYEPNSFRRLLAADKRLYRSCFTARQEGELKEPSNEVVLVVGNQASGLDFVPDSLSACHGKQAVSQFFNPDDNQLRLIFDAPRAVDSTFTVFIVTSLTKWPFRWMQETQTRLSRLRRTDVFTKVIFMCSPDRYWELLESVPGTFTLKTIFLRPFNDAAVRQWAEDAGLNAPKKESRDLLRQITGYWPTFLVKLALFCDHNYLTDDQAKKFKDESIDGQELRSQILSELGLTVSQVRPVLEFIANQGACVSQDTLCQKLTEKSIPATRVQHALKWASDLSLLVQTDKSWSLEPVTQSILELELLGQ